MGAAVRVAAGQKRQNDSRRRRIREDLPRHSVTLPRGCHPETTQRSEAAVEGRGQRFDRILGLHEQQAALQGGAYLSGPSGPFCARGQREGVVFLDRRGRLLA